ncbi:E3 ubiquitin protein ligase [Allofrancisella guangzhouensis]|uniref:RING-type domain-containing protein n=1 Tax=Allofrancisella guangzhouensis TaxID=594679 RepID=A0A0A8E700_9GAMM|nr:RING finger protein [Allofrancisella guangzhouensis]AJC49377.1 hypothetical protein SD28_06980 [Allofrancisella guangzhouensis]MBK2026963.1 E3 ubiquitin protein ligase [Allofrancisella guangzhouensis]MBK2044452.1 E3 ubiquitin protein ligase [Allofrancisella guangzhouensis]MBK2045248.1 E3 ubiquitin protein ligase [Allofrancisella guangzhouensis]
MSNYKILELSEYKTYSNEKCVICMNECTKNNKVCEAVCGHRFHVKCIEKWLFNETNCPSCRGTCTSPLTGYHYSVRLPGGYMDQNTLKVWFKNVIDNVNPGFFDLFNQPSINMTGTFTVSKIKKAINDATNDYLRWRRNRGLINFFWHSGNTGINRANDFNNIIQRCNDTNPKNVFLHICDTIRDYPRNRHSYTSFILNSIKKMEPIGHYMENHDYTSGGSNVETAREYLLNTGLWHIAQRRLTPEEFKLTKG